MFEGKWFKRLVMVFFFFPHCTSIYPILSPLKCSDQGRVNDLPQVNCPDNQQPSQPAEQH